MSYKALYREWRPSTFEEIIEQEHVTRALKRSVSIGRVSHAYLFCGTRGTGKTTMAQILSRAVNCLEPRDGNPCNRCSVCRSILDGTVFDVMEIDAASHNSVENVRNIRDEVVYTPAVARYKVYIIDEVHMLSTGAFNALLKTLEEPPAHVILILATTEPNRLPATILSRCQRYDFHRISSKGIREMLSRIAGHLSVTLQEDAAGLITRIADGALRDAVGLLDQCIALSPDVITMDMVLVCAGIPDDDILMKLSQAIHRKDVSQVLELTDQALSQGKSPSQLLSSLIYHFRNILVCCHAEHPGAYVLCAESTLEALRELAREIGSEAILFYIRELSAAEAVLKRVSQPKSYLEIVLINLCSLTISFPEQASLMERISLLERKVSGFRQPKPREEAFSSAKTSLPQPQGVFDWNKVLQFLENRKSMEIYPFLCESTAECHGNVIRIYFKNPLFRNMIFNDKKHIQSIQAAITELFGGEWVIQLQDLPAPAGRQDEFENNLNRIARDLGVTVEFE